MYPSERLLLLCIRSALLLRNSLNSEEQELVTRNFVILWITIMLGKLGERGRKKDSLKNGALIHMFRDNVLPNLVAHLQGDDPRM